MDPRSIKPGLLAAQEAGTGIFHPTLIHPLTGSPLEAVGVGKRGDIWWPVMGAAEDDDIEKDAEDSADDDTDEDGDKDEEDDDEKDPKAKLKALEEEKDRHYKKRKAAEKELAAARAELEALKAKNVKKTGKTKTDDADKEDDEDDDEEKVTLRTESAAAKAEAQKLKVENAFLRANPIDWVNPGQVMTLLLADDDYEIEFDANGNVDRKSLAAELKRFAKANRHLVKPKADSTKDDDSGDENDSSEKTSGPAMNGQRKGKANKEPTREQLASKYPALNL